MLKKSLRFSERAFLDLLLKVLLSAALLALLGRFSIPLDGEVDITLQTLFVLLPAVLFGWEVGFLSVGLYIGLGALGLGVFPDDPENPMDFATRMSFYGGFYFGFLFAAGLVGYAAERIRLPFLVSQLILWFGGHIIILVAGFYWLWSIAWEPQQLDTSALLVSHMKSLSPGLIIKSALGILIVQVIKRVLDRSKPKGLA